MRDYNYKKIKNFLNENIHNSTVDSILLVSAIVNDSNEELTEAAVHNAVQPFVNWLTEAGMQYTVEMSWGEPWATPDNYNSGFINHGFLPFVNVVVKPTLKNKAWTKEDMMLFKLKFNDRLPITDLSSYYTETLS